MDSVRTDTLNMTIVYLAEEDISISDLLVPLLGLTTFSHHASLSSKSSFGGGRKQYSSYINKTTLSQELPTPTALTLLKVLPPAGWVPARLCGSLLGSASLSLICQ